jgi:ubiquinone/menaquinone biosynthesis C-methylase UbiE
MNSEPISTPAAPARQANDQPTAPARSAKEQFDKQASHYDTQWNSWSRESLAWLVEHARPKSSDLVVDVATGTGFTALAFAPLVQSVTGADVSSGMLEQARKYRDEQGIRNAEFLEAPAEALPLPDESVDIVVYRIAAHHFLDVRKFISEAARVLKPGGRFVIADTTVPDDDPEAAAWQNEIEAVRDPSHVRNHSPQQWTEMVATAGLTITEVTDAGGGITIAAGDWVRKAGCTPEQTERVNALFRSAPAGAKAAFQIRDEDGGIVFTWKRVALAARK